jgi:hypothetical protein
MTEAQTSPTPAPAEFRNGILVFAGGMAFAAVSFLAEHYFTKAVRKVEEEL